MLYPVELRAQIVDFLAPPCGPKALAIFDSSHRQTGENASGRRTGRFGQPLSPPATAQAKLFIELILNDQWRSLKQLKTKAAYATVGKLIAQYQRNARIDLQLFETTSA